MYMCIARSVPTTLARGARQAAWCCLPLLLLSLSGALKGQETDGSIPAFHPGLRISSLSGYAVYYSTGLPEGSTVPTATQLPSDLGLGGSIRLDWTHIGEKSKVMFTYMPSYTGRLRFAAWNALNHSAAFNASRQFGRWKFALAAGADLSNLSDFLFSPTVFASVAAVPATFNELAAAVLTGTFTNPQLASLLTGAPLVESPARNLFFGERMFTSAGQFSLAFALSPRLSVRSAVSAGRSQHLSDNRSGGAQDSYLVQRISSVGTSLDISYAHSSRTQLGISITSSRMRSEIQDVYYTTATAAIGRKMGSRWFLQLSGGLGKMAPVRYKFALDTAPQPVADASLGFRTLSHTFLGSYARAVGDAYGLGAASTSSAGGSWRWARAGRSWWTQSSATWQQLAGAAYANSSGWRIDGGFGRHLSNHFDLLTQCVYLHYSQQSATVPPLSQTAIRVSIIWNQQPHAVR